MLNYLTVAHKLMWHVFYRSQSKYGRQIQVYLKHNYATSENKDVLELYITKLKSW